MRKLAPKLCWTLVIVLIGLVYIARFGQTIQDVAAFAVVAAVMAHGVERLLHD